MDTKWLELDASFREVVDPWLGVVALSKSTFKKYKPFWIHFCNFVTSAVEGGLQAVESEEKLVHLCDRFVEEMKNGGRRYGSMRTCSSAMKHIPQAYARFKGDICKSNRRSPAVKSILRRCRREQAEREDDGTVDIGGQYTSCLTRDERLGIISKLEERHGMAFTVCFQSLMRGDTMRKCKLSRLALDEYEYSGPDKLPILYFHSPTKASEGQSRPHAVGRHVDVYMCAMGATFRYLVWRYDINGDPWPDFKTPGRGWYKENPLYDVTFGGMTQAFKQVFLHLGVSVGKVTHMRKYGALHMQRLPYMDDLMIESLGYWCDARGQLNSNMQNSYLDVNPKAVAHAAEHPDAQMVYLPRQRVTPPDDLLNLIFPEMKASQEFLKGIAKDPQTRDITAERVMEVLGFARICFLQDAAILKHNGFECATFHHPVFKHKSWGPYQKKVLKKIKEFNQVALKQIQANAEKLRVSRLLPHVAQQLTCVNNQLSCITHTLNNLKDSSHGGRNVATVVNAGNVVPNHGSKECPPAPVNTKGFTSLYHLWEQLAEGSPFSPYCSFMEAEARGIEWRRDPPTSSRRRKFWSKLKRLHAWITMAVGKGWFPTAKDALDALEGWRKQEDIGLGSLLMMMESHKVPSPRALAARGAAAVV